MASGVAGIVPGNQTPCAVMAYKNMANAGLDLLVKSVLPRKTGEAGKTKGNRSMTVPELSFQERGPGLYEIDLPRS